VDVSLENPNPPDEETDQPGENREVEEFFQRLPANFHWPKPNDEAIAAAMEAIQRLSGGIAGAELAVGNAVDPTNACSGCGGPLPAAARFCVWCGLPKRSAAAGDAGVPPQPRASEQHHYHHHYHHFVPAQANESAAPSPGLETAALRGRAPGSPGTATGGRAEAAARLVAQDWAQACNTKHLDDLLELYAPDATLIRSNIAPVRSLPAIREFLLSLLEAGLGDVEMESLRLELMGEIAMDIGRCKMLVPVAMGKRREERGKYLLVLVRQPVGTWKIIADCWSADSAVSAPPAPDTAKKGMEPSLPARKPR
jgi:ketosteroid isomerase-like protein